MRHGHGLSLQSVATQNVAAAGFTLDVTGAQLRDALADPGAWGTTGAATGWLLPGLGGARLSGDCRTSVAMQTAADGTVGYAAHNWVVQSQALNVSPWSATNLTLTGGQSDPIGSNTAWRIEATVTGAATFSQVISGAGRPDGITGQVYLKKGTSATALNSVILRDVNAGIERIWVRINLDTGGITYVAGSSGVTVTDVGGGWWRIVATSTAFPAGNNVQMYVAGEGSSVPAGNFTLAWAPQLNLGPVALPYVPTTTAARFGPAIDWLSGIGAYGIRSEAARTNSIRSSSSAGAVSGVLGSGGAVPTHWSNDAQGCTTTITAGTFLSALPAVDVRHNSLSTTYGYTSVNTDAALSAALPGQVWTMSALLSLPAGTLTGASRVQLYIGEFDAASAFLRQAAVADLGLGVVPNGSRYQGSVTTGANTAFVRGWVAVGGFAAGSAIDYTLRIAAPQLELGTEASSPILTYAAAATRAADTLNVLDSGWLSQTAGTGACDFVPAAVNLSAVPFSFGTYQDGLYATAGNSSHFVVRVANAGLVDIDGGTLTAGAVNRIAAGWQANDFAASANGAAVGTDTSGALPVVTTFALGHLNGANQLNGHLTRIRYSRRRASNGQLQALTV